MPYTHEQINAWWDYLEGDVVGDIVLVLEFLYPEDKAKKIARDIWNFKLPSYIQEKIAKLPKDNFENMIKGNYSPTIAPYLKELQKVLKDDWLRGSCKEIYKTITELRKDIEWQEYSYEPSLLLARILLALSPNLNAFEKRVRSPYAVVLLKKYGEILKKVYVNPSSIPFALPPASMYERLGYQFFIGDSFLDFLLNLSESDRNFQLDEKLKEILSAIEASISTEPKKLEDLFVLVFNPEKINDDPEEIRRLLSEEIEEWRNWGLFDIHFENHDQYIQNLIKSLKKVIEEEKSKNLN
jgi:hypothetical protein